MAQKKTTTTKSNKNISTAQKIGFGLTAAAVTAAGAYFLYGSKHANQNRKKVKGWVLKAKGEVLQALENAEAISEAEYNALVDTATKAYGTVKNATTGEVKDFKKEMRDHWTSLQKNNAMKKVLTAGAAVIAQKGVEKVLSSGKRAVKRKKAAVKKALK